MEFKTFGECVAYHRGRLGLTQRSLAEKCGISKTVIGNIENNYSQSGKGDDPVYKISTVAVICSALGIDESLGRNLVYGTSITDEPISVADLIEGSDTAEKRIVQVSAEEASERRRRQQLRNLLNSYERAAENSRAESAVLLRLADEQQQIACSLRKALLPFESGE